MPDAAVSMIYLGTNGVRSGADDVIFEVTTGEFGDYLIPGLPSGFYEADLEPSSLPAGAIPHADRDGGDPTNTAFTLGIGGFEGDIDFGVVGDASLDGTAWNDRNGDGLIDPSEVGVAGVAVAVTWQGLDGDMVVTAASDAFGRWTVTALPAGDYLVSIVPDSMIWLDRGGDGVGDAGEEGIENVLVNLYDEAGELVGIAESAGDGRYAFSGLRPGVYMIELDKATIPGGLLATSDHDGLADLATVVDLTAGVDVLDAHFGFQSGLPVTGFNLAWFGMWGALFTMLGCALVMAANDRRFRLHQDGRRHRAATGFSRRGATGGS